jgi:hypothetical protein
MSAKERYLSSPPLNRPVDRSHPTKPVEAKHREAAKNVLRKGKTVFEALVEAGYAPKQAKKGLLTVRRSSPLRVAFQQEAERIAEESKKAPLFPSDSSLEGLIMARLEGNILKGEDKAVMSCKLAGSHRKLSLWAPESVSGVIVINAPFAGVLAATDVPEDDSE